MNYTFKLSRRLSMLRIAGMFPALLLAWACTDTDPTGTGDSSPGVPVAVESTFKVGGQGRGHGKPISTPTVILTVSPDTATLLPGAQRTFVAALRLSDGTPTNDSIRWTASGGTIDAGGLFTAGKTSGKYRVSAVAATSGAGDSAAVDIVPPTPVLQRVLISPASVSLQSEATQQFLASGVATDGSTVPVAVSWAATGGTISSSGLYTAGSASGNFRVVGRDSASGLADTSLVSVTAPAPPPPPSGFDTTGWVVLHPGDDLRAEVSAKPAGTRFYFRAGTYRQQGTSVKDNMVFRGEPGAILDGENVAPYAFETLTSIPKAVRITGLVIEHYNPPHQQSAIQGDNGQGWTVDSNEIAYNGQHGVRLGVNWMLRGNHVHHNGTVGITCYKCAGAQVIGNEVDHNPATTITETGALAEAANIKLLIVTNGLVVRRNYVHDGLNKGIWLDTDNQNYVVDSNTVSNHGQAGIWIEASLAGVVRGNTVTTCGTRGNSWLDGAGIQVTNSGGVEIARNTVSGCANGITGMYVYATSGNYAKALQNLWVHDNNVTMTKGVTGVGTSGTTSTAVWDSQNNRFVNNTYQLTPTAPFRWRLNATLTQAQWQAAGQD
ncbi:MAG TPA: right-handed parallel beta-helix repeat-containing protein [Gemmatimonadales bacterium]|jgi:parallel beta-helix repeat protein|nr:right-handed parallel beta-helix repeat-containing protein [Gemmatimonadales bacterium]